MKGVMRDNLSKVVERGERLDDLEQRTGTAVCVVHVLSPVGIE